MDLALSAADEAFRVEVRDWLSEHLVGEFADHRGAGVSSDDIAWDVRIAWDRELSAGGWLCIGWPVEFGGRAATVTQQIIFETEMAEAAPPFRASVQGQMLFGPTLLAFGTAAQKERFLPRIVAVEDLWGQGFSEPGAGSDLANLRTTAVLDGSDWVINGQKVWMTHGASADWFYVLARTNQDAARHQGLSMLMVPAKQAGVEVRSIRNMLGGSEFCEVFFSDARTPVDNVVGEIDRGWQVAMGALGVERGLTLLAEHLGTKREVLEIADLAGRRGISGEAVTRDRLAAAWADALVMRYNNLRLMSAIERNDPRAEVLASCSKVFASDRHREIGDLAMDVGGLDSQLVGPDYSPNALTRVFLGSRAESIYGGATEVQLNILGERGLGLPREPR